MKTRKAIFQSVFSSASFADSPTPSSTPQVDSGSFQQDENEVSFDDRDGDDLATRRIRWERAWHYSTTFLTLPSSAVNSTDLIGNEEAIGQVWAKRWRTSASDAVSYLARHNSLIHLNAPAGESRVLVEWYQQEVTHHFVKFQLPLLTETFAHSDARTALINALQLLDLSQSIYLYPLSEFVLKSLGALAQQAFSRFREWHHATVSKSLASSGFSKCLANFLKLRISFIFEISRDQAAFQDGASGFTRQRDAVIDQLERATALINKVGLGGTQAQQVYAEVLDELVSQHIAEEFSWPNVSGTGFDDRLPTWIRDILTPFLKKFTSFVGAANRSSEKQREAQFSDEIEGWKARAIHELASQRLTETFGIVVNWEDPSTVDPDASTTSLQNAATVGLGEMATFLHTAAGRAHVANKLISAINHRLLMPGAATVEILRVYVNIFMALRDIDKTGLLLTRIIRPIRRYLRERDDTVKIIIQALLVDYENGLTEDEALNTFARLVQELHTPAPSDDASVPLYDFGWEPDPVDAAPEWKAGEKPEVFTKLIDIFDSKEVFVKEFQNMLSESLLRDGHRLEQEIRVLELFKSHIGEAPLQACEVMVKDISDSQRTDEAIKRDAGLAGEAPAVTARILSRLYWPSLNREHMLVPPPVAAMQDRYAAGFEAYKPSRKLAWLQNIGHASVELHLRDRVVSEAVPTWQASVIYAFHSDGTEDNAPPPRKTVDDLAMELQMDDELVEAALAFWVARRVLRRVGDAFEVLEELPPAGRSGAGDGQAADASASGVAAAAAAPQQAPPAAGSIRRSDHAVAQERMAIYWQYTVNMLTNQGPMPLQRIVMMLKILVPDGFPFSNDDFRAFLTKQIEEGKLEMAGGNYKIPK